MLVTTQSLAHRNPPTPTLSTSLTSSFSPLPDCPFARILTRNTRVYPIGYKNAFTLHVNHALIYYTHLCKQNTAVDSYRTRAGYRQTGACWVLATQMHGLFVWIWKMDASVFLKPQDTILCILRLLIRFYWLQESRYVPHLTLCRQWRHLARGYVPMLSLFVSHEIAICLGEATTICHQRLLWLL